MKKKIAGEALKAVRTKLQVEFESFSKVRHKLTERFMSVADMMAILRVSRRQAVYLYLMLPETAGSKKEKGRAWHRFSIFDLLALRVLIELKGLRVPSVASKKLVRYINDNLTTDEQVIYSLSKGRDVVLFLTGDKIERMLGAEMTNAPYAILKAGSTTTIIASLYPAFKYALQGVKREDFRVEFVARPNEKNDRVIYFVNDEPIELKQLVWINVTINNDKE